MLINFIIDTSFEDNHTNILKKVHNIILANMSLTGIQSKTLLKLFNNIPDKLPNLIIPVNILPMKDQYSTIRSINELNDYIKTTSLNTTPNTYSIYQINNFSKNLTLNPELVKKEFNSINNTYYETNFHNTLIWETQYEHMEYVSHSGNYLSETIKEKIHNILDNNTKELPSNVIKALLLSVACNIYTFLASQNSILFPLTLNHSNTFTYTTNAQTIFSTLFLTKAQAPLTIPLPLGLTNRAAFAITMSPVKNSPITIPYFTNTELDHKKNLILSINPIPYLENEKPSYTYTILKTSFDSKTNTFTPTQQATIHNTTPIEYNIVGYYSKLHKSNYIATPISYKLEYKNRPTTKLVYEC